MTEKNWCEVCQYKEEADTVEKLIEQWDIHTKTKSHQQKVIKLCKFLEKICDKLFEGTP